MKKPKSHCHCEYIDMGSYDNQVVLKTPFNQSNILGEEKSPYVSIDTCIAGEIGWLWRFNIKTVNSCCGHGDPSKASVIVSKKDIPLMKLLGYEQDEKSINPDQTFRIKLY
jgi:hypothetical protein